MTYILQNQDLVRKEDAYVHIDDRGYYFGDGIYEVIRVYHGQAFASWHHIKRFIASAKKLDMNLPYTEAKLNELIDLLLHKNKLTDGLIYLQMTRGIEPRNHLYSRESTPVLTGFTQPFTRNHVVQTKGINAWLTDDIRWLRCDIKTINLLGNVMAKREATDNKCQEALMHRDGTITEGSSSNLFLVKNNVLYTHPATNLILNGITRQLVIELAQTHQYKVIEEPFPVDVLIHADEAFITSTTMEITPITSINGQVQTTYSIGPVTKDLQTKFHDTLPKN
ncbi:D-amino-acid transaminase [Halalkalibacter nanhaiisediminis]|uniref:D-alanine aminotransferase n=1 Tax=Halalkalibacter nanhaiisediminis TaxID=688079 RepID=A0A562QGT3_9BACI|nr:D-amino-acid transaminase [Halalkalibacter nanhaiisediminis]TWI55972.1 D-alanine transaminase [Halalkalibacter nanhaiisediminis]